MREGLEVMLERSEEFEVVGQARDGVEAVAAGAIGYLQKESGMDQLLSTVKVVAAGEMILSPEVVRRVFAGIRSGATAEEEADLTPREKEILASFSQGMSYKAIAEAREVQAGYHPKRHLHHSGKAGSWHEAGDRGLGRAERSVG